MSSEKKSFVPPFFKNFGKSTKDLFKKKYDFDNTVKVINKSKNGVTIESTGNLSKSYQGTVNVKYVNKDFGEVESEFTTLASAENKASLKLKKLAPGLTVTAGVSGSKKAVANVDVEYSQDCFAAQANIKSDLETTKIDAYGSVGFDGISVGGQVALNVSSGAQIVDTNVGAEYTNSDFTATVFTEKNCDFVTASYFSRLNKDTAVGASFKYEVAGKQSRTLTVGVEQQLDFDTVVKAKAELPTGVVSTAVEHKLSNPRVQVGVASSFNALKQPFTVDSLGFGFTFGDY